MKKIFLFIIGAMALAATSCSDMLEVESDRHLTNPEMNKATDSLFYAWGIMQAMQQAADQYVLQNEMRGDLVSTTSYSDKNLRELANFTATTANKYDSAYVYYKVINNCNYYLAHRDTAIYDGSYNLTRQEYAGVLSFRAWAYLQLARQYGSVKFFTHPLTSISQIENDNSPVYNLKQIVDALSGDMEKYAGTLVPTAANISGGANNRGENKTIITQKTYIPIDVMLGDMYLETAQWEKAAHHYYTYLLSTKSRAMSTMRTYRPSGPMDNTLYPEDFTAVFSSGWENNFTTNTVSYIPMATNRLNGKTTDLPRLFGYNYYTASSTTDSLYLDEVQIQPSNAYNKSANNSYYYYYSNNASLTGTAEAYKRFLGGDARRWARQNMVNKADTLTYYVNTYKDANITLWRVTTVWLHLAEALNRMGYPDAAFAILKDGITDDLLSPSMSPYITDATRQLLQTTLPFCIGEASLVFSESNELRNVGIHSFGCADEKGLLGSMSAYKMDTVVTEKLKELKSVYGLTLTGTKRDTINAMEDIICDEYAMELAFEGSRFSDLMRLARNKNGGNSGGQYDGSPAEYGSKFGNKWLSKKYEGRGVETLLLDENNWYLPFK